MRRFVSLLLAFALAGSAGAAAPLKLIQGGDSLTMQRGGKTLWSRPLHGGPYHWKSELGPKAAPLGLIGHVAYAVYCWEGQRLYCQTAGFDKLTGQPLFDVQGTPQTRSSTQLITNYWSDPADTSFDAVDGFRIDLLSGKAERIRLRIPPRPGCGSLNYSLGLPGRTTYDTRYAYAEQDDRCGVFMARFDWHGASTQKPVLTVTRSKPLQR